MPIMIFANLSAASFVTLVHVEVNGKAVNSKRIIDLIHIVAG